MNNGILQLISTNIGEGEEQITASKTLQQISGLDERRLRKAIEQLRRSGCVIISAAEGGYYKPLTLEEVQRYIKKESHRARSIFFSLKSARNLERAMTAAEQNAKGGIHNGE